MQFWPVAERRPRRRVNNHLWNTNLASTHRTLAAVERPPHVWQLELQTSAKNCIYNYVKPTALWSLLQLGVLRGHCVSTSPEPSKAIRNAVWVDVFQVSISGQLHCSPSPGVRVRVQHFESVYFIEEVRRLLMPPPKAILPDITLPCCSEVKPKTLSAVIHSKTSHWKWICIKHPKTTSPPGLPKEIVTGLSKEVVTGLHVCCFTVWLTSNSRAQIALRYTLFGLWPLMSVELGVHVIILGLG